MLRDKLLLLSVLDHEGSRNASWLCWNPSVGPTRILGIYSHKPL